MQILWSEAIPGGAHWSGVLRRGTGLRIRAEQAGANLSLLLYNYELLVESYNMADTLKGQHTARLTRNHVLYSDMGRAMCSIVGDSCGWHDPICGLSDAALVAGRYGAAPYQTHRNDYHRNGRDSLINELGKYGLGLRDLVPPVNLFSKVTVDEAGNLAFHEGNAEAGATVDLRFEMHCLVLMSTCQHPLDPAPEYHPSPVVLDCYRSEPPLANDPARCLCPENERAFVNTERLFAPELPAVAEVAA